MAMKFLSKKSFHVRRLDNIAKVARAEEKMREEQTKMAELRREREEEKDLEDFRRAQEAAGRIDKAPHRVEWLYKAPQLAKNDDDPLDDAKEKARMDYESLPPEAKLAYPKLDEIEKNQLPGSKFLVSTKYGVGDSEMKKREDPFTEIFNRKKQNEINKQREKILIERVKMQQQMRSREKINIEFIQMSPDNSSESTNSEPSSDSSDSIVIHPSKKRSSRNMDFSSSDSSDNRRSYHKSNSSHKHHRHHHRHTRRHHHSDKNEK